MSQLRQGTVFVATSVAIVRGNYVAILSPHSGTAFTIGETVTWAGGGSGAVTSYSGVSGRIAWIRTAGPAPALANVLTGAASGATGTIASFASDSVPRFDLELPGGGTRYFQLLGEGIVYPVASVSTDNLTLSGTYAGLPESLAAYAVWRDFTSRGYILPKPGDVDLAGAEGLNFSKLDADVSGTVPSLITLAGGWTGDVASTDAAKIRKLANGTVELMGGARRAAGGAVPQTIATLPAGFRSTNNRCWAVRVGAGAGVVQLASGGVLSVIVGTNLDTGVWLDGVSFYAEA